MIFFCALRCQLCYCKMGECMDWNGVLGIVIALWIITLVFWGAQPLMDFLERLILTRLNSRRSVTDHIF
jgi:hypothetical protein